MKWEQAWLNYQKVEDLKIQKYFTGIYTNVEHQKTVMAAIEEIQRASRSFFEKEIVQETERACAGIVLQKNSGDEWGREGYQIFVQQDQIVICANTETGLLYGSFALLRKISCHETVKELEEKSIPDKKFRMLNHWDNTDGTIERGYSGSSFFFEKGEILINERTKDYARLISSIGINAVVINNVNVKAEATEFITEKYLERIAVLAEMFETYGIQLFLSLNYAACMEIGGLDTADPLEEKVIAWWKERMQIVYKYVPRLGGFLVKADSEGRPGPFTYGRNQAEGANLLAKAIEPYGGNIIWRCFVYNCQQDWRDYKTDRARAAYDYFYALDGTFKDNVILQIKNGPIDFQVREPVMPLFGKLKKTKHIMEVQIAQEYTGHQIDVCYLIPWFKEILETHLGCSKEADTVQELLQGKSCNGMGIGMAAVSNTGDDSNWTSHDLAGANLYGYGRLAWDSTLSAENIAIEWVKQTFSNQTEILDTVCNILMKSWPVYEKYTAPLGVGFMVTPGDHYGPNIDGYEYSKWGTYHRADHIGIGVDRSEKGTGYASLYEGHLAEEYNDIKKCPDNLLLFFHHVRYDHILHNGKTVIQHIYDTHFEGVEELEEMIALWEKLDKKIDSTIYKRVLDKMGLQRQNAREWRDQINSYFYRKSGIEDQEKRKIY